MGYRLWERSGGALDFGAAALYDAWGFGFRNSEFPTDEQIQKLLEEKNITIEMTDAAKDHIPSSGILPGDADADNGPPLGSGISSGAGSDARSGVSAIVISCQ